ncbi:adenine nucleotide alpha hydrolases-like protein [Suhomyces tanzawaensis NRRL Y-17324]|uniref:FAD synthase n=1 Tax=Suhomyces tanzawaensis NRRL Y-17324 TaxID=984487 RepID=A0A1E4SEQ7_9ASCO|nr:adenine nucleotide alpha hydrolases-like protein [Suhomyces tanzawaensis NRRL Y-17324]ODV77946.1 adenine nucleotide alpha hydrolases-like protein [Suhomyces tanzawaensis NRRL Y-17324]
MTHSSQHKFLQRCEQAYLLVQGFLEDTLPWGKVPESRPDYRYDPQLRSHVKTKISDSMEKLAASIDRHGLQEIAISYNGGKDCLVMLILLLATIHQKFTKQPSAIPEDYKLDSIYVNSETLFPQLTQFIQESTQTYHLNPIIIQSSLKEGFEKYLNEINTNIKTIVVGVRHLDPYAGNLSFEQTTDHDWPKFLRIHPILNWNYVDIWDFLIGCNLQYCSMYDEGYTSLGGVKNTVPNPFLKDGDRYLPAYRLTEDADARERLGRIKK